ncbi:MAG: sporulation protein YunB [Clostridia bacterium]|nr:sporulation protein YunB [Clostridia bacterium]MDE6471550.1 sporulation protein YunB [Clostridia bacterium]
MCRCARRKIKAVLAFIIIIAIVISCLLYFRGNLVEYVDKYASALITTKVVDIFNSSTTEALTGEMFQDKDNFYEIRYDNDGNVALISGDMVVINALMRDVAAISQREVNLLCESDDVQVPYSSILGSVVIANYGGKYSLKLENVGNIQCNYRTTFESVGINQTLLCMYIDLFADISVMLPLCVKNIKVQNSMVVYQNLIVGKVPEFYFQYGLGNSLKL